MAEFDPYHKWLAIPPTEQPPNLYRLLALNLFEGDADVIDSAANARMIHLRSLQTGPHAELTQRLLNEIAAARLCLLKPEKEESVVRLHFAFANGEQDCRNNSATSTFAPIQFRPAPPPPTGPAAAESSLWILSRQLISAMRPSQAQLVVAAQLRSSRLTRRNRIGLGY